MSATAARLTLALPVDVARTFDATVTQTQLSNNTFQASADDRDLLASYIEDAEDEFRAVASAQFREARAGISGDRETYEQLTYDVSGHNDFKRQYTGVGSVYDAEVVEKNLDNGRILPFDAAQGDEAYIFRGLGGSNTPADWEDVTDDVGDTWAILDHRAGTVGFHPIELFRAMRRGTSGLGLGASNLKHLRFAISYRFGTLGGSRTYAGATTLGEGLQASDTDTGVKSVADATRLPSAGVNGGTVVLLIGQEYVRATVDAGTDEIDIEERAIRGTNAAAHSSGDRIQYTPPSIRKAVASRAGMQLISSGRYAAFAPESEDALEKSDILDGLQATWDATVKAASD